MPRKSQGRKVRGNNVNPLFTQWLEELRDEAASKNSNAKYVYTKALQSLNKFPLPLKSGKDCSILKNFGQKICNLLDKKLEEYKKAHPDFDENSHVPVVQKEGGQPKRAPKAAGSGAEHQPGPSGSRGSSESNGNSIPRPKPSGRVIAKPAPKVPGKAKSSALASLRINKVPGKIPHVRTTSRKSNGKVSSQTAQRAIDEPREPSPSPPVLLPPQEIKLPRFSFGSPEVAASQNTNKPEHEVIDLSQHEDSPEPAVDVDSLISLTERLIARSSKEPENNPTAKDAITDANCDNGDDDEDDCVIIAESFGAIGGRPLHSSPGKVSPPKPENPVVYVLDDEVSHQEEQQPRAQLSEDSFMNFSPEPCKAISGDVGVDSDSILDVTARIRRKRKSFLDKLSQRCTQPQTDQANDLPPSFLNSPKHSVICNEPVPSLRDQRGVQTSPTHAAEPQKCIRQVTSPPRAISNVPEDSEDELLIPLSQRLGLQKPPPSPTRPPPRSPTPPPPNDSFAQLVENFETPPADRGLKSAAPVEIESEQHPPARKRKKTKAPTSLEGDAAPKKKARKNKEKPAPVPAASVRIFNLRYVPEGSRLPGRTQSDLVSHSPSKCPHKISLKPGTFDIILCVDSCEAKTGANTKKKEAMIQALQSSGIRMDIRKMNIGDFAWIAKCGDQELVLDCVVERKRTDDLACSIKDGRYAEQKHRLLTSGIKRRIYLIEEHNRYATGGIPDQALLQAQMNTQIINDFIIKVTKNTKETARYLTTLTRALELKYKDLHLRSCLKEEAQMFDNHLMTWQEYNEASYKRKKVCAREMFIRALMMVRMMSLERALTITTVYPTVTSLLQAFDGCDEVRQKDNLLADLKCPISGRRIGPALSKVIKQIFVDGHDVS